MIDDYQKNVHASLNGHKMSYAIFALDGTKQQKGVTVGERIAY